MIKKNYNNSNKYTTIDGEYKVKLRSYKSRPYNLEIHTSNIIQKNNKTDMNNNNVFFMYNEGNALDYKILSTLKYNLTEYDEHHMRPDNEEYFYFEHKYPDMCSITQSPMLMPTYNDGIVDIDDVDYNKFAMYDKNYDKQHGVAMISDVEKKINKNTGMKVNKYNRYCVDGFYKFL